MEAFYTYILQVNIGLVVYYLLYRILFSQDTFLEVRRIFLCSVILLAFLHPLISMIDWWTEEPPLQSVMLGYAEVMAITVSRVSHSFTWQYACMWLWTGGVIVDLLFSELLCIIFWFNPVVWLFRREIRQNLEFLADQMVVGSGYNRKNYQYHLLRLSHQPTAVSIVNNFNVSQLKRRIIMMNKKRTSRMGLVKYAVLLPVTGILILVGNAPSWAEMTGKMTSSEMTTSQETRLEGLVVDENGQPLPGVIVVIKGSTVETVTDSKGKFILVGYDHATLCFSFVGKKMEIIEYTKHTKDLKLVMQPEVQQIEEVVVVGYINDENSSQVKQADNEVFMVVEEMPQFKEGSVQQYMAKNLRYPKSAVEHKIEGKVYLSFIIDKTGNVVEPEVIRSVDPELDKEALRIISNMPAWQPGKQHGKAVRVKYTMPVHFRLESKGTTDQKVPAVEGNASKLRGKVLYVVDGKRMPHGFDVNTIPVTSIESISLLKDKSAADLYGKEGKDGVIIITTKKE